MANGIIRSNQTKIKQSRTSGYFGTAPYVEQYLLDNLLLRYDAREKSGLDVLFTGIDKIYSLNADYLDIDNLGNQDTPHDELTIGEVLTTYPYEVVNDQLLDISEKNEDEAVEETLYVDEGILNFTTTFLGYGQSMASDIFALAPESLDEVVFNYLFKRGEFEKGHDDLFAVAKCIMQRRDLEEDIKKIWPRYTLKRYEKNKTLIEEIIRDQAPSWAKKFSKIWDKLTPAQIDAIRCEYFHGELIKPTQIESAKKLGISVASYQERLEWAYKKIARVYPEYKRKPRRKNRMKRKSQPEPLYQILENSEKIQIPFPIKKD